MSDYPKVYVRPATDPATGEVYRVWHPTQFRQPIPATGGYVPNDPTFTGRQIRDGVWIKCDPPPPAVAEPAPGPIVAAELEAPAADAPAPRRR